MQLNRDRLHVWCASLEISSLQLGELERTLDDSEITRANKFYFERDRRRFVAARGMLRAILANYLETTPSALRFSYNEFGKPSLEGSAEIRDLRFNVSHSGGLVLIAVALARDVGVDIEMINPSVRTDEVARSFFSPTRLRHSHAYRRLCGPWDSSTAGGVRKPISRLEGWGSRYRSIRLTFPSIRGKRLR
jgi:4'-phosphopantetheinyl transferase